MALAHQCARGSELVLIALHALAVDQMRDVQQHFAVFEKSAADLFVERLEEPVHLKADGSSTRLPFPSARSVLPQVAEISAACRLAGQMPFDLASAAIIHEDLQVHLRFAAEFVNIAEELPLVGADGFAKAFVVVKDGSEAEGKDGGMAVTVRDDPRVIHAGFLVEGPLRIVLAHDHRKIACRVKENLIATDSKDRFHRNRFTMTL